MKKLLILIGFVGTLTAQTLKFTQIEKTSPVGATSVVVTNTAGVLTYTPTFPVSKWTNDAGYLTSSSASVYVLNSGNTVSVNLGANSLSVNATSTIGPAGSRLNFNNGVYNFGNNGVNQENLFFGKGCGTVTTSGIESAVFGLNSAPNQSLGNGNSIFGTYTARSFTNAGQNCVFASDALSSATVTSGNNCFGVQSLASYTGVGYNNSIGLQNMRNLITGTMNIGDGYRSAETFTNGNWNIFLGANTSGLSQGNYNTLIGSNIIFPSTSFSNNIILSDGQGNIKYRHDGTNLTSTGGLTVTGGSALQSTLTVGGGGTVITGNSGTVSVVTDVLFTTTHFHSNSFGGGMSNVTYHFDKSLVGVTVASSGTGITYIPYDCTLVGFTINSYVAGTLGTTENVSVYVRVNNATDITLTSTHKYSAQINTSNSSAINTKINSGSYIEIKIIAPIMATPPTNITQSVTLFLKRR